MAVITVVISIMKVITASINYTHKENKYCELITGLLH